MEVFSCADGWLAYPVCFCVFLYMVRYFLLTLYIAFLLNPLPVALSFRMWGGQGEVAGLSKDAGAAADSFPQVDGMAMQPACHAGWSLH